MVPEPERTASPPAEPQKTSWFQLGVVAATEFVMWTGFGAVMPFLPIFLRNQGHSSLATIGIVAAMFYVGTLAFSSPLGWLSDIVGRKPVMVCGTAVYCLVLFLFTRTVNPYWFILFRLIEGISTAAGGVIPAFVADISTPAQRSRAYGILMSAQYGGVIAGPALATPIFNLGGGGHAGFCAIFYFGAAITGLTSIAVALFVHEPAATRRRRTAGRGMRPAKASLRAVLAPAVLAFVVVGFTSHLALGGFEVVWSIWLEHLGASMTYISATWIAFSVPMLLSFAGGILADRRSRFALMFAGYCVSGLTWIAFGMTTDFALIIVVCLVQGFALAFGLPPKQALLVQVSPPRWVGTVTGLDATSTQLGALVGTLVAPVLYGAMSGWVFAAAGVVSLAGLVVAAPILSRAARRPAPTAPSALEEDEEQATG